MASTGFFGQRGQSSVAKLHSNFEPPISDFVFSFSDFVRSCFSLSSPFIGPEAPKHVHLCENGCLFSAKFVTFHLRKDQPEVSRY